MATTYETIEQNVQNQLWTLIHNDTTSITFPNGEATSLSAIKVTDGFPAKDINNEDARPLIIVHGPSSSDTKIGFTGVKCFAKITSEIEIVTKEEKTLRLISGRIRKLIRDNLSALQSESLQNGIVSSEAPRPVAGEDWIDHVVTLRVNFDFGG